MATRFQAASLVASPLYPSAVAWSDENLIAVASGHLITILNPAQLFGPRGLITIPPSKPFPFGVIERKDLFSSCLLPTSLSRDLRPCVRSISWSPIGLAPNAGCLLSVCTTEGRVNLYRMPYCEFSAEWVEVCDISELMYSYFSRVNFLEDNRALVLFTEQENQPTSDLRKEPKRRRKNSLAVIDEDFTNGDKGHSLSSTSQQEKLIAALKEVELFSYSLLQEGSSVEVLMLEGNRHTWIAGKLNRFDGTNAFVRFPQADDKGKQAERISLDPQFPEINSELVIDDYLGNKNKCAPKIRPSIRGGYLPLQISAPSIHGVENILKIGDEVEAWTNDRWIEGTFLGSNESGLLVKFHGDIESVILDASSVRLVPLWIDQEKSWQITLVKITIKDREDQIKPDNTQSITLNQFAPVPNSKAKAQKQTIKGSSPPSITADQYASRSAMLSSLVVAWSPIVKSMPQIETDSTNYSPNRCSVLAVGGKSGKITLWRIDEKQYFASLSNSKGPTFAILIGILQAHSAWTTAISWSLFASDISDSRLLLATGSSDGSVKMWMAYSGELLKSSEVNFTPFSLFKEVIPTNFVPISVVTLLVSKNSPHKVHLAVGKGSGSFDVLITDLAASSSNVDKIDSYGAHDHIVTGLVWAFDGSCLYSCSQDNSVHSWSLFDNTLSEVPIPLNPLGEKSSNDVPNVFDSCFGLAISPGNIAIAVARSFDAGSLNPMYQQRSQKAAVEFFWIGGQQIDTELEFVVQGFSSLSEREQNYWNVNLLWSLNQYEDVNKPLVVWDIIEALATFKQFATKYVEHILAKWLNSLVGTELDLPIEKTLAQAPDYIPKMSSRQLHLLNIVIRHLILTELNADQINLEAANLEALDGVEDENLPLWLNLLLSSEKELRERLLAFSFAAILDLRSQPSEKTGSQYQLLVGIAQMEQWVSINRDHVKGHLELLTGDIKKLQRSKLQKICEYAPEEKCSFCSASVPFESAEVGFCPGGTIREGVGQSHKLFRCAASMKVCPITPSWFCVCCRRRVSNLPPSAIFRLPAYPLGFEFSSESFGLDLHPAPLCPFCGILLQRLQPEFLLSTSPV